MNNPLSGIDPTGYRSCPTESCESTRPAPSPAPAPDPEEEPAPAPEPEGSGRNTKNMSSVCNGTGNACRIIQISNGGGENKHTRTGTPEEEGKPRVAGGADFATDPIFDSDGNIADNITNGTETACAPFCIAVAPEAYIALTGLGAWVIATSSDDGSGPGSGVATNIELAGPGSPNIPPPDDEETKNMRTQDHHMIPHNNSRFQHHNHPLVKQAKMNLKTEKTNMIRLLNHSGRHSKAYHQVIQQMMNQGYKRVAGKGQMAAQNEMHSIMNRIHVGIRNGTIRPYNSKNVWPSK